MIRSFSLGRDGAITKEADLLRHDFSPETFAPPVLCFVVAGRQPSFDVDLPAFGREPLAGIRPPFERDDPMPVRALLLRAVAVRETLGRYHRKIRQVLPELGRARITGLAPRLPITITLLIAIAITSVLLCCVRFPSSGRTRSIFIPAPKFFPRGPGIWRKAHSEHLSPSASH